MTTMTTPTTADLRVLSAPCPTETGGCGATPEARCTTPSGRPTRSHTARVRAALEVAPPISVDSAGTATTTGPETPPVPAGPSTDDLVLRLLVLKVLAGRIAEADADARDDVAGRLDVGVSLPGYLTPDDAAAARRGERDRCLGKVGLSRPSQSYKVTDVDALTRFVAQHAPDEVEHRPVIRNSFLTALLASAKANDGQWLHPGTGELLELPGVELSLGRPTLQVRPSADAGDLVAEALALGLLTADGTPALPAGNRQ